MAFSTILAALLLPVVGAIADRSSRQKQMLGRVRLGRGRGRGVPRLVVAGDNWQLGVLLLVIANINLVCSLVVYDALLCQVATPDERDRVSSRGWALGYLGGFLLLAVNLAVVQGHDALGLTEGEAVRLSLATAGLWWALFTVVPVLGLRNREPLHVVEVDGVAARDESALAAVQGLVRPARRDPARPARLPPHLDVPAGLPVLQRRHPDRHQQLQPLRLRGARVRPGPADPDHPAGAARRRLRRAAVRPGGRAVRREALRPGRHLLWLVVVVVGFVMPAGQFVLFLGLAVLIGVVMGGTQALSRSLYSQLVPVGREAEYFSLYQAAERGTSWFGAVLFGVVYQLTDSYRPAIISLMVFFVVGGGSCSRGSTSARASRRPGTFRRRWSDGRTPALCAAPRPSHDLHAAGRNSTPRRAFSQCGHLARGGPRRGAQERSCDG